MGASHAKPHYSYGLPARRRRTIPGEGSRSDANEYWEGRTAIESPCVRRRQMGSEFWSIPSKSKYRDEVFRRKNGASIALGSLIELRRRERVPADAP